MAFIEPCFGIGHNLSLICQITSEDIKHQLIITSKAFSPLARAREEISIKIHNTECRLVIGPSHLLSADVYVGSLQPGYFTGWDSEGVKSFVCWFDDKAGQVTEPVSVTVLP